MLSIAKLEDSVMLDISIFSCSEDVAVAVPEDSVMLCIPIESMTVSLACCVIFTRV